MAEVRNTAERTFKESDKSNQSGLNLSLAEESASELNLPLAEVLPSKFTPQPTEELASEEPSQNQSSHPTSLPDSPSDIDVYASIPDEERPDHLNYAVDEDDGMLETNLLERENRAYAGRHLPPSEDVINVYDSDTDVEALFRCR